MAKILIGLSVLFLTLSAVFGVLNTNKARSLREAANQNTAVGAQAEQARLAKEKEIQAREASVAAAAAKNTEVESRVASAESDLIKTQQERAELQAKLQQNQKEIEQLRRQLEDAGPKELMPDALPMPGAGDLQTQLEETRRQLDHAEREKQLLADKIRSGDRGAPATQPARPRAAAPRNPGLRGTVLAVNQAYNFVVLNLGNRQGVEPNSEMLVLRGGTLIGRIRVSSVEPATAIGDIITSSLPRGVQVQPGDIVIYAGSTS
jgi:nitrogen fixation protein FixH